MGIAKIQDNILAVGSSVEAVVPSDSVAVSYRALYVGGLGNVKVTAFDGTVATFVACPAGFVLPVAVKLVWSTGTTATFMVGIT